MCCCEDGAQRRSEVEVPRQLEVQGRGVPVREWDPELEGREWKQGEEREDEVLWNGSVDGERRGWQREEHNSVPEDRRFPSSARQLRDSDVACGVLVCFLFFFLLPAAVHWIPFVAAIHLRIRSPGPQRLSPAMFVGSICFLTFFSFSLVFSFRVWLNS